MEIRASSLAGTYAKLDQADEHFKALESEIQAFVKDSADAARGKLQSISGRMFYVMEAHDVQLVPLRVGLILGDAIHNLRAALDHTIWQLVLLHGGKPDPGNQFPIFSHVPTAGRDTERWNRNVKGIIGPDLALIQHVQPHRRDDPSSHPLAALADLSNTDKHRLILASVLSIELAPDRMPEFDPHDLEVLDQMQLTYGTRLRRGTEIFRVPVRVTGPDPHMEVRGSFPAGVAFGEAEYEGPGLNTLRVYVRQLVESFENPEVIQTSLARLAEEVPPPNT